MNDALTISVYDQKADEYAASFDNDKPGSELKRFMDHLPKGANVLDLGCGTGNASAHMVDEGLKVLGTDASEKMLEHARQKSNATFKQALFDDLTEVAAFDGIWANFSLLHAPRKDMPRYLKAIHTALKSNGIFHIGMKTGKGEVRDGIDRMYTFYTEAELSHLLTETGFEQLHAKTGAGKGLAGTIDPWVVILSRKKT